MNNTQLRNLVKKLNANQERVNKLHVNQMNRLRNQAKAMNALGDKNYLNAKEAAIKIHKKHRNALVKMRNQVVNELKRNSTSSQNRRNLYAEGINRGRYGTSNPNWQTWANILYRLTVGKKEINNFFNKAARSRKRKSVTA